MQITRDENHIYRVDGVVKPSVHQILDACKITDVSRVNEWYLERGTHVHTITEMIDDGELDYEGLDNRLKPFADAYTGFLGALKPEYLMSECYVYSAKGDYCGQLDRLAVLAGKKVLLDFKSGSTVPWWVSLQLVAYRDALPSGVDELRTVSLKADGAWAISKAYNISKARKAWQSCVEVYRLQERKKV